jgi:transcription elongation factor Elf1
MKKIKPCPFCGAREELLDLDHSASHFFIVCTSCGAKGPLGGWSCINDAEDLWNKSEAARWRDRHADAMAKLAQVREWSDDYDKKKPCEVDLRELDAILADSRKPLQLAGTEVGHRSHVLEGGANGD